MPHWDFRCTSCGAIHDWSFQSFDEMERVSPTMTCNLRRVSCFTGGHAIPCRGRVERVAAAPAFAISHQTTTERALPGKPHIKMRTTKHDSW